MSLEDDVVLHRVVIGTIEVGRSARDGAGSARSDDGDNPAVLLEAQRNGHGHGVAGVVDLGVPVDFEVVVAVAVGARGNGGVGVVVGAIGAVRAEGDGVLVGLEVGIVGLVGSQDACRIEQGLYVGNGEGARGRGGVHPVARGVVGIGPGHEVVALAVSGGGRMSRHAVVLHGIDGVFARTGDGALGGRVGSQLVGNLDGLLVKDGGQGDAVLGEVEGTRGAVGVARGVFPTNMGVAGRHRGGLVVGEVEDVVGGVGLGHGGQGCRDGVGIDGAVVADRARVVDDNLNRQSLPVGDEGVVMTQVEAVGVGSGHVLAGARQGAVMAVVHGATLYGPVVELPTICGLGLAANQGAGAHDGLEGCLGAHHVGGGYLREADGFAGPASLGIAKGIVVALVVGNNHLGQPLCHIGNVSGPRGNPRESGAGDNSLGNVVRPVPTGKVIRIGRAVRGVRNPRAQGAIVRHLTRDGLGRLQGRSSGVRGTTPSPVVSGVGIRVGQGHGIEDDVESTRELRLGGSVVGIVGSGHVGSRKGKAGARCRTGGAGGRGDSPGEVVARIGGAGHADGLAPTQAGGSSATVEVCLGGAREARGRTSDSGGVYGAVVGDGLVDGLEGARQVEGATLEVYLQDVVGSVVGDGADLGHVVGVRAVKDVELGVVDGGGPLGGVHQGQVAEGLAAVGSRGQGVGGPDGGAVGGLEALATRHGPAPGVGSGIGTGGVLHEGLNLIAVGASREVGIEGVGGVARGLEGAQVRDGGRDGRGASTGNGDGVTRGVGPGVGRGDGIARIGIGGGGGHRGARGKVDGIGTSIGHGAISIACRIGDVESDSLPDGVEGVVGRAGGLGRRRSGVDK